MCILSATYASQYNQALIFFPLSQLKVPGPLTAEIESKQTEKKKTQKALRRQREKEQREEKRKQELEAEEKKRFASLTDREKVRLLSDIQVIFSNTVNILTASFLTIESSGSREEISGASSCNRNQPL